MECLDKIIPLSRTTCECFDSNKPTDYNEGLSEVYLDELEGLELRVLEAVSDCATGNLWELMEWAREEAIKRFTSDLLGCLEQKYVRQRNTFSGLIGRATWTSNVALTPGYAGVRLDLSAVNGRGVRSGVAILNRIGLAFNASATFDVYIYNNVDPAPVGQYTVTTVANQVVFATLTTPLELPLSRDGYDNFYYYIVYPLNGTYLPKNNGTSCGSCGSPQRAVWEDWFALTGWKASSLSALSSGTSNTPMNGLILDLTLKCRTEELICSDLNPLDIQSDGAHAKYPYAVRFKAGELLIEKILSTPNVNRYTMLGNERLWGKRNHFLKTYNDWIAWLCDRINVDKNDCLKCDPNEGPTRKGILA